MRTPRRLTCMIQLLTARIRLANLFCNGVCRASAMPKGQERRPPDAVLTRHLGLQRRKYQRLWKVLDTHQRYAFSMLPHECLTRYHLSQKRNSDSDKGQLDQLCENGEKDGSSRDGEATILMDDPAIARTPDGDSQVQTREYSGKDR